MTLALSHSSSNGMLQSWHQDTQSRQSWTGDISKLTAHSEDGEIQGEGQQNEITKKHWINNEDRPNCPNKVCQKKFSLIERPHHCRRCGEVFCNTCVQYKRKLTFLAKPDPDGKLYKVCQPCFEEGRDFEGQTRNLTKDFRLAKHSGQSDKIRDKNANSSRSWRDKFDLQKEVTRLKDGFEKSVGQSEVKRTLQEMKTMLSTPDWQKSTNWLQESLSERCCFCCKDFGLMRKKLNCKVCAISLCKSCCQRELLVYIPDNLDPSLPRETQIAIIKVIGSPEVEPEISILLHVCGDCRRRTVDLQVSKVEQSRKVSHSNDGPVSKLKQEDFPLHDLQPKIIAQLQDYQSIIESLDDGRRSAVSGSNTKILAKAQEDLSEFLAQYILKVQRVKNLIPLAETEKQRMLFKNYLKAKSEFYLDKTNTFRSLKRRLEDSAPAQVLEYIQRVVDRSAIVSSQLYTRQLILEAIYLCDKYSLEESIPTLLSPVDKVIELEARQCLQSGGDNWDEHMQHIKEMNRTDIKDHRLVRPSTRALVDYGYKHAAAILLLRSQEVVNQVSVQLALKSAHRSFRGTKKSLAMALEQVTDISEIKQVSK